MCIHTYTYTHTHICIYIYIYTERERDVYIYIYIYIRILHVYWFGSIRIYLIRQEGHPRVSTGGMTRLETLIELKILNSSFSRRIRNAPNHQVLQLVPVISLVLVLLLLVILSITITIIHTPCVRRLAVLSDRGAEAGAARRGVCTEIGRTIRPGGGLVLVLLVVITSISNMISVHITSSSISMTSILTILITITSIKCYQYRRGYYYQYEARRGGRPTSRRPRRPHENMVGVNMVLAEYHQIQTWLL